MISRWFQRREVACRRAVELMSDYLDGALDDRDRLKLERHLGDCPHCVEYLAQLRLTVSTLAGLEPTDLDEELVDELVELYRRYQS